MARESGVPQAQQLALGKLKDIATDAGLYLAGGTGLAHHFEHRVSNIDLFSRTPLESLDALRIELAGAFDDIQIVGMSDVTLQLRAEGTAIDIVSYSYPLLEDTVRGPFGFPVAGHRDLIAMKLAAVSQRGIRRDFWDLFVGLRESERSLEEALADYAAKFGVGQSDLYYVLRSLTYFEDALADVLLPRGLTPSIWQEVERYFQAESSRVMEQNVGR